MLLTLLTLKMLNPTLWDTRAVTSKCSWLGGVMDRRISFR